MLEKPIVNCGVCGNPYPYRKGKQYCSPNCRQKAFARSGQTDSMPKPVMEGNQYSFKEYQDYISAYGSFPLITFLFLRRNLDNNATLEEIMVYINGLYDEHEFIERMSKSDAFQRFENDFLDNKYMLSKA